MEMLITSQLFNLYLAIFFNNVGLWASASLTGLPVLFGFCSLEAENTLMPYDRQITGMAGSIIFTCLNKNLCLNMSTLRIFSEIFF